MEQQPGVRRENGASVTCVQRKKMVGHVGNDGYLLKELQVRMNLEECDEICGIV